MTDGTLGDGSGESSWAMLLGFAEGVGGAGTIEARVAEPAGDWCAEST